MYMCIYIYIAAQAASFSAFYEVHSQLFAGASPTMSWLRAGWVLGCLREKHHTQLLKSAAQAASFSAFYEVHSQLFAGASPIYPISCVLFQLMVMKSRIVVAPLQQQASQFVVADVERQRLKIGFSPLPLLVCATEIGSLPPLVCIFPLCAL